MEDNALTSNQKVIGYTDGKYIEKTDSGTYLTHAIWPMKISGTEFIPQTDYELSVIAGNFNDKEGIDFEVTENLPDLGSNITKKFYDMKVFQLR